MNTYYFFKFSRLISTIRYLKIKQILYQVYRVRSKSRSKRRHENVSDAVINYFSNGSKNYSKERIEMYSQEKTLAIDNWRRLKGYIVKAFSGRKLDQDKGHSNKFQELITNQKNGGEPIIPFDEIINTSRDSFAAIDSLKEGKWISVK